MLILLLISLYVFYVLRGLLLLNCILYFWRLFLSAINGLNSLFFFICIYFRLKKCIFRMNISWTVNRTSWWIVCTYSISWTLRCSHKNIMGGLGLNCILAWKYTNFLDNITLIIFEFLKIKWFYNITLWAVMSIWLHD